MTISGTGSTGSAAAQYTNKANATSDQIDNPASAMGQTDFLQMLVTKLRYQDPLSAEKMDESFIADIAQFSSLEQMSSMNSGFGLTNTSLQDLNKNMIGLMLMQNTTQAASLIGKSVTVSYKEMNSTTKQLEDKTLTGTVSVVRFVDGTPKIVIGGIEYDLSAVKEISA